MDSAKPVVIEQTSKRWKALRLAGGVAMGVSVLSIIVASAVGGAFTATWFVAPVAALFFVLGLALSIFARVAAWWHHG